jgi:hypothetical protein
MGTINLIFSKDQAKPQAKPRWHTSTFLKLKILQFITPFLCQQQVVEQVKIFVN